MEMGAWKYLANFLISKMHFQCINGHGIFGELSRTLLGGMEKAILPIGGFRRSFLLHIPKRYTPHMLRVRDGL